MKITRRYIRNLILESKGGSCPSASGPDDTSRNLNKTNKAKAAKNPEIAYGEKGKKALADHFKAGKYCGNCIAFNVTKKMLKCMDVKDKKYDNIPKNKNEAAKYLIKNKMKGYCTMLDFSCGAHKTCLKWIKNGPKK